MAFATVQKAPTEPGYAAPATERSAFFSAACAQVRHGLAQVLPAGISSTAAQEQALAWVDRHLVLQVSSRVLPGLDIAHLSDIGEVRRRIVYLLLARLPVLPTWQVPLAHCRNVLVCPPASPLDPEKKPDAAFIAHMQQDIQHLGLPITVHGRE